MLAQNSAFQSRILQFLDKVLNEVDLSVTSEKMIRAKVTAELGEEVQKDENLALIKEHVKGFLLQQYKKREAEELDPPPSGNPLMPKKKSRTEEPAANSKPSSASGSGGGVGGATWIDLGSEKRASYTNFKGKDYFDLREFYTKGDEKLPGKKGIMLKPDEFKKIVSALSEITTAARACNVSYALDLGSKRKVSISSYKNKTYVDVREFYQSGGEDKPGQKGLSMNLDQWQRFTEGLATLQAFC